MRTGVNHGPVKSRTTAGRQWGRRERGRAGGECGRAADVGAQARWGSNSAAGASGGPGTGGRGEGGEGSPGPDGRARERSAQAAEGGVLQALRRRVAGGIALGLGGFPAEGRWLRCGWGWGGVGVVGAVLRGAG